MAIRLFIGFWRQIVCTQDGKAYAQSRAILRYVGRIDSWLNLKFLCWPLASVDVVSAKPRLVDS